MAEGAAAASPPGDPSASGSGARPGPIVVVGAGAAGLMAAIHAAGGAAPVILLERTTDGGRKILISGGGRCNVLPSALDPRDYVTDSSPHTLRKLLLSWPLPEQRRFFEETLGMRLVLEPETGKLFPEGNRSREVRDRLVAEAHRRGVEVRTGVQVTGLRPPSPDDPAARWTVRTRSAVATPPEGGGGAGRRAGAVAGIGTEGSLRASAVILATGGLSVPATGSDGTGLRIAEGLGHTVHPLYPALTPLTQDPPRHAGLAGVSLTVSIEAPGPGGLRTRGGFLFTHRGFSGPSVLNVSHLAVRSRMAGEEPRRLLTVGWADEGPEGWDRRLREGSGIVAGALRSELPQRLAEMLLQEAGVEGSHPLHRLRKEERKTLVQLLTRWPLPWTGDEGYRKAEVTGGGVALSEVNPRTLESRRHPGLFLCGEMLDAFGPIGGYNFAWAWATGRSAGEGARGRSGAGVG